jgi:NADPH-dependent 2,4-dienoyl-CoA reductase/sulfur reductase-like enzyme
VHLRTSCRAAHLDAARSVVTLDTGESVSYDHLLLATGCTPRPLGIPGQNLPSIYSPRTIDDYEQLQTVIHRATTEGHRHAKPTGEQGRTGRGLATVIGAGMLGVEIAAALTQSGLSVDLIASGSHPWSHLAGETTGKFLARYLSDHGVKLHLSQRAQRIEGDGRAQRVILTDGTAVPCDFVVSAAGTIATKDILRGTGIIAEKAILTDEHCRTNIQNIYAAGDCAAVRDPLFGKHRTPDPWDTAEYTGALAGANMTGANRSFDTVTTLTTEAFDLKAQAWGHSKHIHRRLMRGSQETDATNFVEIGITPDGRIAQILAIGNTAGAPVYEALIRRRFQVDGHEDQLRDPAFPLERLLA